MKGFLFHRGPIKVAVFKVFQVSLVHTSACKEAGVAGQSHVHMLTRGDSVHTGQVCLCFASCHHRWQCGQLQHACHF